MAEVWDLPAGDLLRPTGPEWLLHLLVSIPACQHIIKGKMVVNPEQGFQKNGAQTDGRQNVRKKWVAPPLGEAKLNTDGAYSTEAAGTGMALRDHRGEIIYAACRSIPHCGDAIEAEIMAIEEGLQLALHWTALKFTVELSCPHGLHRWSVFVVITRDITDNVASDFDLRHVVHAMARVALPSV
ncbi:hypothetical protein QYE76_009209 [Lolium multiflorum]|uniref:RNase H type-1 domain-containing protein n=1 Tax=Lolium multiflorum TaxID=4521 RepID=A0AAD8TT88_LOLMU|nr:hypothetical protein QYE76_009209 [Lolium multiflorum]